MSILSTLFLSSCFRVLFASFSRTCYFRCFVFASLFRRGFRSSTHHESDDFLELSIREHVVELTDGIHPLGHLFRAVFADVAAHRSASRRDQRARPSRLTRS